jgi:hypothetical protein
VAVAIVVSPTYLIIVVAAELLYLAGACFHPGFRARVAFADVIEDYVAKRDELVTHLNQPNLHRFGIVDERCQRIVERDTKGASGRARFQLLLDLNLAYLKLLICGQEPSRNSGAIVSELTRIEQSVEQIAEEMNALVYDDTLKERINATLWTLEESRKITDSEMSSEE